VQNGSRQQVPQVSADLVDPLQGAEALKGALEKIKWLGALACVAALLLTDRYALDFLWRVSLEFSDHSQNFLLVNGLFVSSSNKKECTLQCFPPQHKDHKMQFSTPTFCRQINIRRHLKPYINCKAVLQ